MVFCFVCVFSLHKRGIARQKRPTSKLAGAQQGNEPSGFFFGKPPENILEKVLVKYTQDLDGVSWGQTPCLIPASLAPARRVSARSLQSTSMMGGVSGSLHPQGSFHHFLLSPQHGYFVEYPPQKKTEEEVVVLVFLKGVSFHILFFRVPPQWWCVP